MIAALFVETNVQTLNQRLQQRLKPSEPTGCLLWTGSKNKKGYGQISVSTGKYQLAHRVAWELIHGPINAGLCVLHRCDTPACCNVDHLFLGTRAQNNADMRSKGRARQGVYQSIKTHCLRGHELSGDNLYVGRDGKKRSCRACKALWSRNYRAELQ